MRVLSGVPALVVAVLLLLLGGGGGGGAHAAKATNASLVVFTYTDNVNFGATPYDWAAQFAGIVGIPPESI